MLFSRCLSDDACQGYQYHQMTTGRRKFFLIHKGGETVQTSTDSVTFEKGITIKK